MRYVLPCLLVLLLSWTGAPSALAHFGMIIPSSDTVTEQGENVVDLAISFSHPFAGKGMNMHLPKKFGVWQNGEYRDLLSALKPAQIMDAAGFKAKYAVGRPGVYAFAVEPEPYFEPAEDRFIAHYVKTVIGAFGGEDGWEKPLGLPVEIVPRLRPFANYAGNVFVGQVLEEGRPAAGALVEVEALNANGARSAPNEYFETQTVLADENGIFAFGIPWAGWWGFAALRAGQTPLPHPDGAKEVELGGVLWVNFANPRPAVPEDARKHGGSLWQE